MCRWGLEGGENNLTHPPPIFITPIAFHLFITIAIIILLIMIELTLHPPNVLSSEVTMMLTRAMRLPPA